ncbi:MAG: GNAT family N-acetyltransferase [Actinomycetota bacterium]|nr:GNAT family N-acetyltransferase [Actinomycetota bacterium]
MVDRQASRIATPRLVLEPVTRRLAEAVVTGRLGGIRAGPGWPHQDTADAMAMALSSDSVPSWVITVDAVVIGDCGAFAWPDERGVVEIGYGLAEPFRGRGFATEGVAAMCKWLGANAAASAITATSIEVDNLASRRVLDKLGFIQVHSERPARGRPPGPGT